MRRNGALRGYGGATLTGEIGEIWTAGHKVGIIHRWQLVGWREEWRLEAERYRLDAGASAVELRLDMRIGEVIAFGNIWTEYLADGRTHDAIVIKGGNLRWQDKVAVRPTAG